MMFKRGLSNIRLQHTPAFWRLGKWTRYVCRMGCFNTQPPEGGWATLTLTAKSKGVSTHSRLKAAGTIWLAGLADNWFQHTAA